MVVYGTLKWFSHISVNSEIEDIQFPTPTAGATNVPVEQDFVIPSNGYLYMAVGNNANATLTVMMYRSNGTTNYLYSQKNSQSSYILQSVYVRKGLKITVSEASNGSTVTFYPIVT